MAHGRATELGLTLPPEVHVEPGMQAVCRTRVNWAYDFVLLLLRRMLTSVGRGAASPIS